LCVPKSEKEEHEEEEHKEVKCIYCGFTALKFEYESHDANCT
jgi:hypothetical protein